MREHSVGAQSVGRKLLVRSPKKKERVQTVGVQNIGAQNVRAQSAKRKNFRV